MNAYQKYKNFIQNYLNRDEYIQFLSSLKQLKEKNDESVVNKKDDYNGYAYLIFNPITNPLIINYIDDFYHEFIGQYKEKIIFNLKGHFPEFHGKSLLDVSQLDKKRGLFFNPFKEKNLKFNYGIILFAELMQAYLYSVSDSQNETESDFHSLLFFEFENNQLFKIIDCRNCPYCDATIHANLDYDTLEIKLENFNDKRIPFCESKSSKKINVTLDIPSKKLVILNHIGDLIDEKRKDEYEVSINSDLGRIKHTEFYASLNIGFFLTEDVSPTVFMDENEIIFGNDNSKGKSVKSKKEIGYIVTDLHGYCILDSDLYFELCKKKNKKPCDRNVIYVDIPTNKIKINHSLAMKYQNIYTKIKFN